MPSIVVFVVFAGLLTVTSGLAGMFWWRSRALPLWKIAQLARELTERQRALEALFERLEKAGNLRPTARPHPNGPLTMAPHRLDPPQTDAVAGPTLISVPDLTARPTDAPLAATELAERFGTIWERAERGEPAEAIARAIGQPIGQVELVLGLRRRLASTEGRS